MKICKDLFSGKWYQVEWCMVLSFCMSVLVITGS